ncbi:MAG: M20/M25/M40 family metallo-hydrolase [Alphaproteobacteria bacterium]|nr:M20/M25/M40 family metallo-hydrolase [Alphaproteobacteria bacterium]
MSDPVPAILAHVEAGLAASLDRLFDFLRIPSISAQPDHAGDCRRAAEWACAQLAGIGFEAGLRPTAGHPIVVAHHPGKRAGASGQGPHLLYYGHYDVQPPEPLALWTSDPFAPALVDGPRGKRIVARGAVDDKGQVMTFIEALRAWHTVAGGPPTRVSVFLEGEEECGSPSLPAFLDANRAELAADLAIVCDTSMWDFATPAITTRLRGMCYVEITLKGPNRDLHSGMYGGSALNPINALARILGQLHDADGRVQVPGFYDRVTDIPPALLRQWEALGFDEGAYLRDIGLSEPAGERQRFALERLWARPTADINGIWGGYTGAGSKTVIASEASAKLSFRLVPDQDPAEVFEGLKRFVAARAPADARIEYKLFGHSPGIAMPEEAPWLGAAQTALAAEFGRAPVLMGCGGSIPVVEAMRRQIGLDSLLVGFGLDDDQIHSPNEKFELECFRRGIRANARLLASLAALPTTRATA